LADYQGPCGVVPEDRAVSVETTPRVEYDANRVGSFDFPYSQKGIVCGNGAGSDDNRVDESSQPM
jgi:hypothetical protein